MGAPDARRPTRFQLRTRRIQRVRLARQLTQAAVGVLIVVASVRHRLEQKAGSTASVDALCPFGGSKRC